MSSSHGCILLNHTKGAFHLGLQSYIATQQNIMIMIMGVYVKFNYQLQRGQLFTFTQWKLLLFPFQFSYRCKIKFTL